MTREAASTTEPRQVVRTGWGHRASTTEGEWAGVRPSPGAASSDLPDAFEHRESPVFEEIVAPGDGRTPVAQTRRARTGSDIKCIVVGLLIFATLAPTATVARADVTVTVQAKSSPGGTYKNTPRNW
jgi:hypothetical protein